MSRNLRVLGSRGPACRVASPRAVEGAAKVGLQASSPRQSYLQSGIQLTGPAEKRRVVAPWGKVSWELHVACFPAWCQGNRIGCKSLKRLTASLSHWRWRLPPGMCQTRLWDPLQMGNDSGVGGSQGQEGRRAPLLRRMSLAGSLALAKPHNPHRLHLPRGQPLPRPCLPASLRPLPHFLGSEL